MIAGGDFKATKERTVFADLDMSLILGAKSFVDVVGHHSGPDELWLGLDKRDRKRVREDDHEVKTMP